MARYQVYFEMHEKYWYRYDVEAESPEKAYEDAEFLMQTSPGDPDDEIYDCIEGPFLVSVEDSNGKVVYENDRTGIGEP